MIHIGQGGEHQIVFVACRKEKSQFVDADFEVGGEFEEGGKRNRGDMLMSDANGEKKFSECGYVI